VSQGFGLVGYLYDATVTDSYWNSDLNTSGGGGTGKTTAQMQSQDFADLLNDAEVTGREDSWRAWQIIDGVNSGMPVLSGVGLGLSAAPAVITDASGAHNLAAEAEISFDSDCLGEYYYDIVEPGGTPSFDTTGSGILCYEGTNTATLPVSSGALDLYITVKNLAGTVSDPVKIELAVEPALFAGGSGTDNDPYQIATPYHLHNVRYYLDKCFILTADIDLDPVLLDEAFWYDTQNGWQPIGYDEFTAETFTGYFNGNGHTVSNMRIGSADSPVNISYIGLFGYANTTATICNTNLASLAIYASGGGVGGIVAANYGLVDHCSATGFISANSTTGGLVGSNCTATVINSWADVDIEVPNGSYIGGLVAFNNGYIRNCCATGNIVAGNNPFAGGLVGYNYAYTSAADIQNCYATGDVSGSGWGYIGAFYGQNNVDTAFADCYWNADAVITAMSDGSNTPTVHGSSAECQSMSSAAMKTTAFVDTLNAGLPDTTGYYGWEIESGVNQGYPVLEAEPAGDLEAPAIADSIITTSNITKNGVTLAWEEAEDNVSAGGNLLYRVYVSDDDNLDTVDDIETNGTALTDFSAIDMYAVTGLSAGTTYYFNVIVKDEADNKAAYTTKSVTTTANTGGGSSSPATPTVIVTTQQSGSSVTNATEIAATTSSGTASAEVSGDVVDALLDQAGQTGGTGNDDILELAIDGADDIEQLQITIAQSDLQEIAHGSDAKLNITAPFISVTFDGTALQTIAEAASGGTVTVSAGVVDLDALSSEDQALVGDRPVYDLSVTNGGTLVSDFGGGYATVSIPYTLLPGEDPESVVIYYLADDGSLQAIQGCYDAVSKAVIFKTSHFSQFIIGYNQVSFSDVLPGAWYKDAVDFIAARGITSGTSADSFCPDDNLTRGQFIVLLMNAYRLSPDQYPEYASLEPFADAGDTYYTQYLLAAKGLGIVNGVGNNLYAPEREISRQEMMVMLYNVLTIIDELPTSGSGQQLTDFSDGDQVAEWAVAAVTALVGGEVVSGYNGMINPQDQTTRAEIAQVLYNLLAN